jgi:hypothetical protein
MLTVDNVCKDVFQYEVRGVCECVLCEFAILVSVVLLQIQVHC